MAKNDKKKTGRAASGKISVTVTQAHREVLLNGGFVDRAAGDVIEIAEAEFCGNLHRKNLESEKVRKVEGEKIG